MTYRQRVGLYFLLCVSGVSIDGNAAVAAIKAVVTIIFGVMFLLPGRGE